MEEGDKKRKSRGFFFVDLEEEKMIITIEL
jgi:hypothetical protein